MADTRLAKLKGLEAILCAALEEAEVSALPALARQYRETLKEIEEVEGAEHNDDDIAELLSRRESAGKPGAVRQNRS